MQSRPSTLTPSRRSGSAYSQSSAYQRVGKSSANLGSLSTQSSSIGKKSKSAASTRYKAMTPAGAVSSQGSQAVRLNQSAYAGKINKGAAYTGTGSSAVRVGSIVKGRSGIGAVQASSGPSALHPGQPSAVQASSAYGHSGLSINVNASINSVYFDHHGGHYGGLGHHNFFYGSKFRHHGGHHGFHNYAVVPFYTSSCYYYRPYYSTYYPRTYPTVVYAEPYYGTDVVYHDSVGYGSGAVYVDEGDTYVDEGDVYVQEAPAVSDAPTALPAEPAPAEQQVEGTPFDTAVLQGHDAFTAGRYEEAENFYLEALLKGGDQEGFATIFFGFAAFAQGKFDVAETSFRRAIELDSNLIAFPPDIRQLYSDVAVASAQIGALEQHLEQNQSDARSAFTLAYVRYAMGEPEPAAIVFEQLAAAHPDDALVAQLAKTARAYVEQLPKPEDAPPAEDEARNSTEPLPMRPVNDG